MLIWKKRKNRTKKTSFNPQNSTENKQERQQDDEKNLFLDPWTYDVRNSPRPAADNHRAKNSRTTTAPIVFGAAVVSGVEEVFAPAVVGTTRITVVPQYPMPIVATPAPVVTVPPTVVAPARPVVVAPPVVSPECYRTPHVSTTTITTQTVSPGGAVTIQSYTRPISAYEMGIPSVPVPVEHRVGTAPYVNPYVYRHR